MGSHALYLIFCITLCNVIYFNSGANKVVVVVDMFVLCYSFTRFRHPSSFRGMRPLLLFFPIVSETSIDVSNSSCTTEMVSSIGSDLFPR